MNHTVGYIDLRNTTIAKIAGLLLEKLGIEPEATEQSAELEWNGEMTEYNGHMVASYWPRRIEKAQYIRYYEVIKKVPRIRYGDEPGETHKRRRSASPAEQPVNGFAYLGKPSTGIVRSRTPSLAVHADESLPVLTHP